MSKMSRMHWHSAETARTGAEALEYVAIAETEHKMEVAQTGAALIGCYLDFGRPPSLPSRQSRSDRTSAPLAAALGTGCLPGEASSSVGAGEHALDETERFLTRLKAWILSLACES